MPTLGTSVLTLADWAKRCDPNGITPDIVELLSQQNDILQDMAWMEGNLPTGHRIVQRTSLPSVAWRRLNEGTTPSKSTTAQLDEACGMLEAWSEVDVDLAKLNGDLSAFRLTEAQPFFEAMNQEFVQTLFYGNSATAPEEFTGFAPRYNATTNSNGQNIVLGGGAGADNASLWLVVWGPNTIFGMFPKGSMAGLSRQDLGEQTIQTSTGISTGRMRAFVDHYQWKAGLVVKDWRYAVRVPNIDISALAAESSNANLTSLMIKAIHRIPSLSMGRPVFYMNRTLAQYLDIQRLAVMTGRTTTTNYGGSIQYNEVDGKFVPSFRGIPIRICDQLTEAEAVVS